MRLNSQADAVEKKLHLVILHYIGCRPEGVPEGASVQWEVELLGYEKAKVN
jgi:hypothetical protein